MCKNCIDSIMFLCGMKKMKRRNFTEKRVRGDLLTSHPVLLKYFVLIFRFLFCRIFF